MLELLVVFTDVLGQELGDLPALTLELIIDV